MTSSTYDSIGIRNGFASSSLPATAIFGGERREAEADRSEPPKIGAERQHPIPASEVRLPMRRRQFTMEYKRRIVEESQRCRETNQVGALLRREGLYSSHLAAFKAQLAKPPATRGRKPQDALALLQAEENRKLRRENARLQRRLAQAELIIDVQKKVSQLLGIPLAEPPNSESD